MQNPEMIIRCHVRDAGAPDEPCVPEDCSIFAERKCSGPPTPDDLINVDIRVQVKCRDAFPAAFCLPNMVTIAKKASCGLCDELNIDTGCEGYGAVAEEILQMVASQFQKAIETKNICRECKRKGDILEGSERDLAVGRGTWKRCTGCKGTGIDRYQAGL